MNNSSSLFKEFISIPLSYCSAIEETFNNYALSFHRKDDISYNTHIQLKHYHTNQVCIEVKKLGWSLGMTNMQIAFCEVIAYLHDMGRFEQFDTYSTFSDAESENHSEMAIRIAKKKKLLHKFTKDEAEIIYRSILNHNIASVPLNESPVIDFYSRLLRDADKLDIWRVALEYNIFHKIKAETFPEDYTIPGNLLNYFRQSQVIPLGEVDSYYDSILFRLSWLYDLNFKYTLKEFRSRKLDKAFLDKLPPSAELTKIADIIENYLEQTLNQ